MASGPALLDDSGDQPIERAEVALAALDHLPLPGGRLLRPAGGIDEAPAQVLELVDAVEHHGDQVGRLRLHQVAQDLRPPLLAADVELDELGVLVLGAAVDRLDLELHVEHLARVEAGERLEPVEQARRMAAEAQLAPRHHPSRHDRALDGRRREHQREVERDDPPLLFAGQRPDRRGSAPPASWRRRSRRCPAPPSGRSRRCRAGRGACRSRATSTPAASAAA